MLHHSLPYRFEEFSLHVTDHCNYNCKNCMHFSPYLSPKEYSASDYFEAIDSMIPKLSACPKITLTGGEPFLHSNLPQFVSEMKERYSGYRIALVTNAYWLRSHEDVNKYKPMLQLLSNLFVSAYKKVNINLINEIRKIQRIDGGPLPVKVNKRTSFFRVGFNEKSQYPVLPSGCKRNGKCQYITCPQLLANGKLMKCVMGYAFASSYETPLVDIENSTQTFYDTINPSEDLEIWRERYPFDLCYYCCLKSRTAHSFLK